jgi:hypothetical protein
MTNKNKIQEQITSKQIEFDEFLLPLSSGSCVFASPI